ncbi:unnamed protein product [Polarella glacialis]|uniref:Uncharacterized protein n=1 Tax=Polarella glacialis TaxID=89957 RepID=A0A813KDY1_POLGL|nr:unnamed protein product [Polarella glacialis]
MASIRNVAFAACLSVASSQVGQVGPLSRAPSQYAELGLGPQLAEAEIRLQRPPAQPPSLVERASSTDDGREASPLLHYGRPLVAVGLALAATAFSSFLVLGLALLSATLGLPVPLLAVLPSASAALFALQLLAFSGSKAGAPPHLADLARPLARVLAPRADNVISLCVLGLTAVWLARRGAAFRHRRAMGDTGDVCDRELPHSLTAGAWEFRALGIMAFPLATASAELLLNLGQADSAAAGSFVAVVSLSLLVHQAFLATIFVSAKLPAPAGGGEVLVDRVCNELRALPTSPPRPGFAAGLFSDWLASPGWCVAPAVAAVQEYEFPSPDEAEASERSLNSRRWEEALPAAPADEDDLQGRPLLNQAMEEEAVDGDMDAEDAERGVQVGGSSSSSSTGLVPELFWGSPSAVKLRHPLTVTTVLAYEVQARDLVAGISSINWLDCAVPASVLRRIEELCGDVTLRAHPGQLVGGIAGGRYAACFDWGTKWPWRWPVELTAKILFGAWAAVPLDGEVIPLSLVALLDALMMFVAVGFAIAMVKMKSYHHRYDNCALRMSYLAALQIVSIRASWEPTDETPGSFSVMAGALAAILTLVPCGFTLLAGVGLASTALSRLEAEGLQEHMLPQTVAGWTTSGSGNEGRRSDSPGMCDDVQHFRGSGHDGRDVEVIMPGARKAFAILLPARSRLQIQHSQLLPPVAGRGGEPWTLPPCAATGDRARLPVPPRFLFPANDQRSSGKSGISLEAPTTPSGVTPLAALLAPGRMGRLIYLEGAFNEAGTSWQEAVSSFFGSSGSLLAEEAERLIESALSDSEASGDRPLVVIEVLPAFAAEFMDERNVPPELR